jgi:hypothetical protein
LVWHLSYDGEVTGLAAGENAGNLQGCFSLSNPISVVRVSSGGACGMGNGRAIINEILGNGFVELKNAGDAAIDISDYWLCDFPFYDQLKNLTIECGDLMLEPGELVTVGTSNITINGADGEMGLYTTNSFTNAAAMVDYVEWGSTGHGRSDVAIAAGIWTAGSAAGIFAANMSLIYDGDGDSASDWSESAMSPCVANNIGGIVGDWDVIGNPVTQNVRIQIESSSDYNNVVIQVRNLQGNLVFSNSVVLSRYLNFVEMDLTSVQDGIYFVHILAPSIKRVEKIIKQSN